MTTERTTSNWPSRFEWILIVGGWTTVALLTAVNSVLAPRGGGPIEWAQFPVSLGREMFEYGFWIVFTPLIFWLARVLPLERPHLIRNAGLHLIVAVVVAISVDSSDILLRQALFSEGHHPPEFVFLDIITQLWFVNELIVYCVIIAVGFARDYYLQKKEQQEEAERLDEPAP